MQITKYEKHQTPSHAGHSNFWLGFLLGAGATGAGLYLFGTKSGRRKVRGALDVTENLEETVDDVYHAVVDTYSTTQHDVPRVIPADNVNDGSTISTVRKVFGVLKLFADKYSDRKLRVQNGNSVD